MTKMVRQDYGLQDCASKLLVKWISDPAKKITEKEKHVQTKSKRCKDSARKQQLLFPTRTSVKTL